MSDRSPSSDRLRRMASEYEESVGQGRAEHLAARAMARARSRAPVYRRLVAAMGALSTFLVAVAGLGLVASGSVPGDPLYRVSRAYEAVGSFVGVIDPVEQRLEEAIVLAERGDRDGAMQAVNEALRRIAAKGGTTVAVPLWTVPPEPTTTTTEPADQETTAPTPAPPATEHETATATVEVEEGEEEDPVAALRLAAEALLRSVRSAKENPETDPSMVDTAAAELAAVFSSLQSDEGEVTTASEEIATTTTSPTTSTTVVTTTTTERPSSSTTSTTAPSSSSTSSTSSTTSSTTTTTEPETGGGPGPIVLPPIP